VELNRCYYDAMVDKPMGPDITKGGGGIERCRTLEETCQDCRKVELEEIYTAHFTVCGKPFWCHASPEPLCMKLHQFWHKIRLSLEHVWMVKYPGYKPATVNNGPSDFTNGHCDIKNGRRYLPLKLPMEPNEPSGKSFFE